MYKPISIGIEDTISLLLKFHVFSTIFRQACGKSGHMPIAENTWNLVYPVYTYI